MPNQEPLVTVVIPTRNRPEMALQAIRSALEPVPFTVEILISDNASDDDTPKLAQLVPQAHFVRRSPIIPQFDHFNLCIREARGKYVKLLCDDDWLLPGALAREVAALEKDPALSVAASAYFEVDSTGEKILALRQFSGHDEKVEGERIFLSMLRRENILGPPSTVTFRKSAFPGFPAAYKYAGDWAAWILLADKGPIAFLHEPGSKFRLHDTNLTLRHVEDGTDFLEVHALRGECCRRLTGPTRALGTLYFTWIYSYRFARRFLRYAVRGRMKEFIAFFARVRAYQAPALARPGE